MQALLNVAFGVILASLIGFGTWLVKSRSDIADKATENHHSLDRRLTKIETLIEVWGTKAASILHSPHTPELDALLEKYADRHYELTMAEWRRLLDLCEEIERDTTIERERRSLAGWLAMVAHHKLFDDPPEAQKHV